jgi:hypothetical protein
VLDLALRDDVLFARFEPEVERRRDLDGGGRERRDLLLHFRPVPRLLPSDLVDAVQGEEDRADALVEEELSFELRLVGREARLGVEREADGVRGRIGELELPLVRDAVELAVERDATSERILEALGLVVEVERGPGARRRGRARTPSGSRAGCTSSLGRWRT